MAHIVMTIVHDPETGQIELKGPIDNELYVYGLLEKARQAVKTYNDNKPKSSLVVPFARPQQ
jgi:hypothetical protein